LKVDANLRVEGKMNIFACGDIVNTVVWFLHSTCSFLWIALTNSLWKDV
jgi:hypothetical protein